MTTQDSILHMRVAEEVKRRLDDLRKREDDLPSRSEMVRRLIERAWGREAVTSLENGVRRHERHPA